MAEISAPQTIPLQSLLLPQPTDPQQIQQTPQVQQAAAVPVDGANLTLTATTIATAASRGFTAATLGLTPPRGNGAAEADLLTIRQLLDDMNGDMRENEIVSSAQRKNTMLGGALALLSGLVYNMGQVISLQLELPKAIAKAGETKADYLDKKALADDAAAAYAPVALEFDQLTTSIATTRSDITNLGLQITAKESAITLANGQLTTASGEYATISRDLDLKKQQVIQLTAQVAAATDPATKAALTTQLDIAKAEQIQLETLQGQKLIQVNDLTRQISTLAGERDALVAQRQTKSDSLTAMQTRLTDITPQKVQLESALKTARDVEAQAYQIWTAAQAYADAIPGRIQQALDNFITIMSSFGVLAARVAATPLMPDGGLEEELRALKKENAEALQDLWRIMTDSRERLGSETTISSTINTRLNDLGEIRKTKIGLAFSAIFTSIQEALNSLSSIADPASGSGGGNFSETPAQRLRFAIGGSA